MMPRDMSAYSEPEAAMLFAICAVGLPEPEHEHRFSPPRRWRFDFAWSDRLLAVECEGGTWSEGRHVRGAGFEADCEKYADAALDGWLVLRVTTAMIEDGRALELIERAFATRAQRDQSAVGWCDGGA